ncbi:MAG: nitroreductase family deazaflavin-dependent oxidoreductase [Deltaproteobacteria bacterium]|nr:nitroreductase family deazaflavin-dependent oxidoreductase [Deltaproteobacteria bacterium]
MRSRGHSFAAAVCVALVFAALPAGAFDWTPFEQESTIRILTHDEDGELRDTKVWTVVVGDAGYVRTNASTWLENIQRNPEIQVHVRGYEYLMRAEQVRDAGLRDRVEEAYKEKYGLIQRTMSLLRLREPTVLRLVPRTGAAER